MPLNSRDCKNMTDYLRHLYQRNDGAPLTWNHRL